MRNIALTGLIFLLGCAAFASGTAEPLLGVSKKENGVAFKVKSSGCTEKSDFSFKVEEVLVEVGEMVPAFEHHFYVTIFRETPDQCDAPFPDGVDIFATFQELGIEGKFHVVNSFGGLEL